MHVLKNSEDINTTLQCCADGKMWSYGPLLNYHMDG